MARDVYYQSVGNPLQALRLPNRRPELRLPYEPFSSTDDLKFAGKVSLLLALLGVAALFTQALHLGRTDAAVARLFTWSNILIVTVAVYLISKAISERSAKWVGLPMACVVVAYLYLSVPIPLAFHMLLFAAVLGAVSCLIGRHWSAYCTASPLDRKTARSLESQWAGYLAFASATPLALLVLSYILKSTAFTILVAICFAVVQTVLAASQCRNRPFRVGLKAVISWLTYNRNDADVPGIFQSPGGNWSFRIILTGACVFLSSLAYIRWPLEAVLVPLRNGEHVSPSVAYVATLFPTTLFWPDQFSLESILLWIGSVLLTLVLPTVFALVVPTIICLPVLAQASQFRQDGVTPDRWQSLVDQMNRSADPIERQSLYIGRIAHDGSPLLIPRTLLKEHAHFLGDSGAGKTSLGLSPFIEQLVGGDDCSVIVIDLKADSMELLASLQTAAERRAKQNGRSIPLKQFSNQVGFNTFAFNPLLQSYWSNLELYMKTDILCGALGLTYGSDYGEGYYSSANAAVLYHTIKTYPEVKTFRELADRVSYVVANAKRQELHPEIRKAGVHVHTVLNRLGSFEALNVAPGGPHSQEVLDHAVDFRQVFTEPQVQYFHLSATLGPGSSPEIGRLVAYSLLAASTQTERKHQVYLVVDEFQRMVARNIEYMLQLARSMGVGVILANQSMQDLKTSTADLIPAIEANCRYRQWFAVSAAEDRKRLIESSGETINYMISQTESSGPRGKSTSVQTQEQIAPRLSINDVLLASDHPRQSIVKVSRGAGYAQLGGMPVIVESNYHITPDEYERRKATAWPDSAPGSFLPGKTPAPASSATRSPTVGVGPVVTTEVIGSSTKSPTGNWTNPFESFGTTEEQKPTRKTARKRSTS